jgi:hypothetical protein
VINLYVGNGLVTDCSTVCGGQPTVNRIKGLKNRVKVKQRTVEPIIIIVVCKIRGIHGGL